MILKQENIEKKVKKAPFVAGDFLRLQVNSGMPHRFYRPGTPQSKIIAGYRDGEKNTYIEKLLSL